MMKKILTFLSVILLLLTSCRKGFLDIKPDQSLVVPQTLSDFQALLDNTDMHNVNMPSLQEVSGDDYYIKYPQYQSAAAAPTYTNAYIWNKDLYAGSPDVQDWNYRYRQIFYANVVLEGLEKLRATDKASVQYASEKGTALFYRAYALYQLAQLFCKPYQAATAGTDPGVPVRTSSDINQVSSRGTVEETYNQIVNDLQTSAGLLPATVDLKTRPSRTAAEALLARVYLSMSSYPEALASADAALKPYATLLDYNALSATASYPFARFNNEVIFHSTMLSTPMSNVSRLIVDTTLYATYQPDDLRLKLYFKANGGVNTYKGSYNGSATFFNGLATDELYLIRAECYARQNQKDLALADLNALLVKRFKTGTYQAVTAANADSALAVILRERRKELVYRGQRWTDLRRLNQEDRFKVTLRRNLNGSVYTLPPGDLRYVLPIPDLVIQLSGIAQNPR